MRKLIAVVGLTLVAGGCVHSHGAPAAYAPPPLDAWFVSPEPELRFRASRPAHAAVFEIVPGVGTSLLYPSAWASPYGSAGGSEARVFEDAVHRDRGAGARAARNEWRAARSPRYLFLVASDYPLELGDFARDGYVSSAVAGDLGLSGQRPLETMERLVEITVPWAGDDNTWTSDFYVEWPRDAQRPRRSMDVRVACDGYEVIVPEEYAAQVQRELCAAADDGRSQTGGGAAAPAPSAGRPRPRPESPVTSGGQGYRPRSRQLEQPGSRGPESRPVPSGRGRIDGDGSAEPTTPPAGSPRPSAPTPPEGRPGRANPATPANPNGPGQPATPATPANPSGRGRPANPAQPNGRGEPATPANPNGRGEPAAPATPANPAGRGEPATPDPQAAHAPAAPADTVAVDPLPSTGVDRSEAAQRPATRPSTRRTPPAGDSRSDGETRRD